MFVFASTVSPMASVLVNRFLVSLLAFFFLTACGKKSTCPSYLGHWPGSSEKQQATDSKKDAGQNLNKTEDGAREVELSAVRVTRDKNGIVVKKQPKRIKKRKL